MGLKLISTRLKPGELIITFLHLAVILGDQKLNSFFLSGAVEGGWWMFFQVQRNTLR